MLPVRSQGQQLSRSRAAIVRRSRCCSHISSAFCGSADCACAARAVHSSNSRWQPSRRTCVDLQSWLLDRRRLCRPGALRERSVQFVASRLRGKRWSQCVRAAAPPGVGGNHGLTSALSSGRPIRLSHPTSATKSTHSGSRCVHTHRRRRLPTDLSLGQGLTLASGTHRGAASYYPAEVILVAYPGDQQDPSGVLSGPQPG
jgi:hypothetical protein